MALSTTDSIARESSISFSLSIAKDGKLSEHLQLTFPRRSETFSTDEHLLVSLPSHLRYRFRTVHRVWNDSLGPISTSILRSHAPLHARLVQILRMKLAERLCSLPSFNAMMGERGERQRFGQRTLISFGVDATLAEWESFTRHIRQMVGITVLNSPPYTECDVPRFQEDHMELKFLDYSSFMRCLGHISHADIVQHLVATKSQKRNKNRKSDVAVRLIGDFVQDGPPSYHITPTSSRTVEYPMTIVLGGTLTPLDEGRSSEQLLVLHRSSCQWDTRDHLFVEDLEIKERTESELVDMMSEDVREQNRVLLSGQKRKRETERYLGFRFTRREKRNHKRLHFDRESAGEVLGDLQVCIPTLTFIVSTNAADIAQLCTKDKLCSLYHSSPFST